ncbi:histidine--tRNA ligase [Pseudalkalibacillus decolorationis]|uniref:histidine--tRNA ligase n=1 Tax=Pseudalkalibacillus decolorationis TaxID=163879 RepID=UPI002148405B|nr:histidine--tRNA ligase [Pseudalkalibacillus decolorationis]
MSFQIPRGTQDIMPGEVEKWQKIEEKAKELCKKYNYHEIRTPIFEYTELFQRGVGDSTDIVQKEMYTFKDRGDRSLTLRPEGTASTVRAYVQNKLFGDPQQPTKLYYIGPMFRYERPQKGRTRQFVQFGIEALGSNDPAIDAEVIALAMQLYQELGLKHLRLVINSLGDQESRQAHRNALVEHFQPVINELCSDCQNRIHTNPLRILDCKKDREHESMNTAPSILEFLNEESQVFFENVKSYLEEMGIDYVIDPTLVRGLDYYNHTAFEIMSEAPGFGAITTLSGGGRYNGLVEDVGGPETPGIGFAMSLERILLALEAEQVDLHVQAELDCYLISLGEHSKKRSMSLLNELRNAGLTVDRDYLDKKMKAQFKAADRLNARYVLVLGDDELDKGVINIKDMQDGSQVEVAIDETTSYVLKHLEGGS